MHGPMPVYAVPSQTLILTPYRYEEVKNDKEEAAQRGPVAGQPFVRGLSSLASDFLLQYPVKLSTLQDTVAGSAAASLSCRLPMIPATRSKNTWMRDCPISLW